MKIINDSSGEYKDVINSYYNLEQYDSNSTSEVLFQGYSTSCNDSLKDQYKNYNKRAYLNLEAPCAYTSTQTCNEEQTYFSHVYTICPYSAEWLNKTTDTKFIPIPFPYKKECFNHIDYNAPKEYDAIYMGHLLCKEHLSIIDTIKDYNYIHASISPTNLKAYTPTHINISSNKKWDLLSKTKVSIAINLCPLQHSHRTNIVTYPGWEQNQAFNNMESGYMPQFKPRVIESMVCKTLTLVKYDSWNVIEHWFEPDKHFIYWHDIEDLSIKLQHIVNNYKDYQHIIDDAYEKVQEYEITKIYNKILEQ
jgi:hypothetical protein